MYQPTDTSFLRYQNSIVFVGLLVTVLVATFFRVWSGDLSNGAAIVFAVTTSFFIQLTIWQINLRFQSFSLSLLLSIILISAISFIPFGSYVILAATLALTFLFLKKLISAADIQWKIIFSLAFIYSIYVIASTGYGVQDAFANGCQRYSPSIFLIRHSA